LSLRSLVFENDPLYLSLQYSLKIWSLSMVWNENDRFWLFFTKTLVFMPETGSLHTGTGLAEVLKNLYYCSIRLQLLE
jgi:hypothetical protein